MNLSKVEEAKKKFIKTGRLNRNIIRDEISISWYKCRLNQLLPTSEIICHEEEVWRVENQPFKNYAQALKHYLEPIVDAKYEYLIADQEGNVFERRATSGILNSITNIDELHLGTNGGALALKLGLYQIVSTEEHYLDALKNDFTIGLPLKEENEVIGVVLLKSTIRPSEYEINQFRERLLQYNAEEKVEVKREEVGICLSEAFILPKDAFEGLENRVRQLMKMDRPIVIHGESGTGKTTLAWHIVREKNLWPCVFSAQDIPKQYHEIELKRVLSRNEAVIIEDYDVLDDKAITILTVYTENILRGVNGTKTSDYKAKTVIMTTVNSLEEQSMRRLALQKLNNRLALQCITLPNLSDFKKEASELVEKLLCRLGKEETQEKERLTKAAYRHSFKTLCEIIEENAYDKICGIEKVDTLALHEHKYIMAVYEMMDENISATADALQIGRSTLYRKLEKHQTVSKKE